MAQARRSLSCHALRTCGNTASRRMRLTTFFEDVLQHGAIERHIGDDLLELGGLLAELPQLANLGRTKLAKAFLPDVEGRFGDTEFAGQLGNRRAELGLS